MGKQADIAPHTDRYTSPSIRISRIKGRKSVSPQNQELEIDSPLQPVDGQSENANSLFSFFEATIAAMAARSAQSYHRAVQSFGRSLQFADLTPRQLDVPTLNRWIAAMVSEGKQPSTVSFYFDNLRTLYNKLPDAAELPAAGAFTAIRCRLDAVMAGMADWPSFSMADPEALNRLAVALPDANSAVRLVADTFFYALYAGGASLLDVIGLKADGVSGVPQAADIAEANRSAKRGYIFPLQQGRRTDRQIAIDLGRRTLAWFSAKRLPLSAFDGDTALTLWADYAVRIGIDPAAVGACVPDSAALRHPVALVEPLSLDSDGRMSIRRRVADSISHNPLRWHAMRLRPGVTPDDIERRVAACGKRGVVMPETFYPTEEFVRIVGKKHERATRAFIADTLFFKSTDSLIAPLFSVIGDLAWCMRQTSAPGSPYAVISSSSMLAFQRMVGQFTPDMADAVEVAPAETLTRGRRVRIVGGLMSGYEGIIHDCAGTINLQGSTRLFQLIITGDCGIQWTAEVPEIFIEPLE